MSSQLTTSETNEIEDQSVSLTYRKKNLNGQRSSLNVNLGSSRLLVVSNRLPITITKESNGSWSSKMSSGGLVAALSGLESKSFLWIGWVGCVVEKDDQQTVKDLLLEKYGCIPVFLNEKVADQHYNGFSNGVLWPLFHYLPGDIDYDEDVWQSYEEANKEFANVVKENCQPKDYIWVHDYHLMLLPSLIHQEIPTAPIGFFLHIPFPSSEIFRVIPCRKEILLGILDCNLIGFHTYDYARHFLKSCTRILGLETAPNGVQFRGRFVPTGVFPVGIEPEKFISAQKTSGVIQRTSELLDKFAGKRVMIGIDRLDYIKGMPHKLLALERLFQKYPQWRGQVVLIQVAVPSRTDVEEYQRLKRDVDELVGRINGEYGELGYSPVHYLFQSVEMNELCSLYSIADVCVVTSIRDGMNLVCQEYVACQLQRRGVLVLSEFAGAAQSLSGCLMVNPWNIEEMADIFHQALSMPFQERLEKHQMLFKYISKHTASYWGSSFVKELQRACSQASQITNTPPLNISQFLNTYSSCNRRLLVFVYDEALVQSYSNPSLCRPPSKLLNWLNVLGTDPKNDVYIVSGRDKKTISKWLGKLPVNLAAEYGCFLRRYKNKEGEKNSQWEQMVTDVDVSWKDTVRPMLQHFQTRTPGTFFEEEELHLTWHYRNADPVFGSIQARELQLHLDNLPVEVIVGNKNLAVRSYGVNPSIIIKKAFQELIPQGLDMILVVGEVQGLQTTDFPSIYEDNLFLCSVGKRTQREKFYLKDSHEVCDLISDIAKITNNIYNNNNTNTNNNDNNNTKSTPQHSPLLNRTPLSASIPTQ